MTRKRILVVMPEAPYPPRKNGVALRYYPLLQRLCVNFDIDLAIFADSDQTSFDLGDLRKLLCRVVPLRSTGLQPSLLHRLRAHLHRCLPFGVPFAYYDYETPPLVKQLRAMLSNNYDTVLWVTQNHVLYACLPYLESHHLLIDSIDSPTLHIRRSLGVANSINRMVINKTRRWEAAMINKADTAFYISPVDLDEVKELARGVSLELSPNGILIEDYTTEKVSQRSLSLGFLGNMSYRPNIDAAHRLHALYRKLKEKIPELCLYIIGRDPDPSLLEYAKDSSVVITGTIDNIWPYVNSVDVFVMPMAMGAGQQNKMLEVMYAGRPIVASSIANGGVLAIDGESILIADDDEVLQQKVLSLLQDPVRREFIASQGAKFVREKYDWDEIAGRFAAAM